MSQIKQWKCDGPSCDAIKKSENHWWVMKLEAGTLALRPLGNEPVEPQELTLCGEKCVVNRVSAFMSAQDRPIR